MDRTELLCLHMSVFWVSHRSLFSHYKQPVTLYKALLFSELLSHLVPHIVSCCVCALSDGSRSGCVMRLVSVKHFKQMMLLHGDRVKGWVLHTLTWLRTPPSDTFHSPSLRPHPAATSTSAIWRPLTYSRFHPPANMLLDLISHVRWLFICERQITSSGRSWADAALVKLNLQVTSKLC